MINAQYLYSLVSSEHGTRFSEHCRVVHRVHSYGAHLQHSNAGSAGVLGPLPFHSTQNIIIGYDTIWQVNVVSRTQSFHEQCLYEGSKQTKKPFVDFDCSQRSDPNLCTDHYRREVLLCSPHNLTRHYCFRFPRWPSSKFVALHKNKH